MKHLLSIAVGAYLVCCGLGGLSILVLLFYLIRDCVL